MVMEMKLGATALAEEYVTMRMGLAAALVVSTELHANIQPLPAK
jgi:hypothetical protein